GGGGVRRRAYRDGAGTPDCTLSALRVAVGDPRGQRTAMGRSTRCPYRLDDLAVAPGGHRDSRATAASAYTGEGGAVPSDAQCRGAGRRGVRGSGGGAGGVRSLAAELQSRAVARGIGTGDTGESVSTESACLPGATTGGGVWAGGSGTPRAAHG